MRTIEIVTTATASIREVWVYTVEDDVADELIAEPYRALDLLAENEIAGTFVSVADEVTGDEEDREVEEVRIVEGPRGVN